MNLPIPILSVLIGAIILFFGRRLFWLCVAAVGFAAGVEFAPHLIHEPSPVLQLTIAIVFGFIGAILLLSLFDWALIVMSAVVGAYLIGHTIVLPQTGATILFIGLALLGIVVQAAAFRRRSVA